VATILSAQCTDKRVNEVTPGLFKKYPTPQDFAAVAPEVLANDIRSTGFFNNKAKSIVGAANGCLGVRWQGSEDDGRNVEYPGRGAEDANVVWERRTESLWAWWWIRTCNGSAAGLISRRTTIRRRSSRI